MSTKGRHSRYRLGFDSHTRDSNRSEPGAVAGQERPFGREVVTMTVNGKQIQEAPDSGLDYSDPKCVEAHLIGLERLGLKGARKYAHEGGRK